MDVEKSKGKKRGVASSGCGGSDPVLQWGKSKRLRGGTREALTAKHASRALRKTSKTNEQTSDVRRQDLKRPFKQASQDRQPFSAEGPWGEKKLNKRHNSCISSTTEGKSIIGHRLSTTPKSLPKAISENKLPCTFNKTLLSTKENKEMVVARRGLEAGIHIGTFQDEMQNLEVYLMPRFMIALSHKEKEEDFMAMKGSKLPLRPKRRAKHVQKALHFVSPGTWLCELSWDRYEVREKKSIKKKSWGLKGMTSADSESLKS